jgi:hypothetical protein
LQLTQSITDKHEEVSVRTLLRLHTANLACPTLTISCVLSSVRPRRVCS